MGAARKQFAAHAAASVNYFGNGIAIALNHKYYISLIFNFQVDITIFYNIMLKINLGLINKIMLGKIFSVAETSK